MVEQSNSASLVTVSPEKNEDESPQALVRGLGLRVTPQRLLIVEAIQFGRGHVTAETIHERVAATYPYLNLTTIYRNLETLVGAGLVTETNLGGKCRYYELARSARHHHLVCERCGGLAELSDALVAPLRQAIHDEHGFMPRVDHLAVFGVCRACREAECAPPGDHLAGQRAFDATGRSPRQRQLVTE